MVNNELLAAFKKVGEGQRSIGTLEVILLVYFDVGKLAAFFCESFASFRVFLFLFEEEFPG
jgi:hypothetical protein